MGVLKKLLRAGLGLSGAPIKSKMLRTTPLLVLSAAALIVACLAAPHRPEAQALAKERAYKSSLARRSNEGRDKEKKSKTEKAQKEKVQKTNPKPSPKPTPAKP